MAGITRQVLFPVARSVHQGMLSAFIPRHQMATESGDGGTPKKTKVQLEDAEEAKIKRLFSAYDRDHNGYITRGEWYDVVFKFLGDKDGAWILAEKIMDDLDKDVKDEKVTFAEFRAGMKSQWHLFRPKIHNVSKE